MLPPHLPQNIKARTERMMAKQPRPSRSDLKPLARLELGNIRFKLRKAHSKLRQPLKILGQPVA